MPCYYAKCKHNRANYSVIAFFIVCRRTLRCVRITTRVLVLSIDSIDRCYVVSSDMSFADWTIVMIQVEPLEVRIVLMCHIYQTPPANHESKNKPLPEQMTTGSDDRV